MKYTSKRRHTEQAKQWKQKRDRESERHSTIHPTALNEPFYAVHSFLLVWLRVSRDTCRMDEIHATKKRRRMKYCKGIRLHSDTQCSLAFLVINTSFVCVPNNVLFMRTHKYTTVKFCMCVCLCCQQIISTKSEAEVKGKKKRTTSALWKQAAMFAIASWVGNLKFHDTLLWWQKW